MSPPDPFFDPLDEGVLRDPYPFYKRLRAADPVHWHQQLNSWVLTRYADCALALGNSELFAADFRRVGVPTPPTLLSLQTLDPPDQTALRQFSIRAVLAQDLSKLEENAAQRADELLAQLASQPTFDFVSEFADRFTLGTISTLLGVGAPEQDQTWAALNEQLHHSMDCALAPEAEAPGLAARACFNKLVEGWLDSNPRQGVLGYIMQHGGELEVSREVLVNSIRAFWHAGFEVPSRFLGNATLALLKHGRASATLRNGESLDTAIEELVRYAGPVQALSRACTADTTLDGRQIRKGDIVIAMIAAANRDPEQFSDPEDFIPSRNPNRHLGFGRGTHSCLGTQLARLQARVAFTRLLRRYPHMHLVAEATPRPHATLRGLASLPMALGAETASPNLSLRARGQRPRRAAAG
jgi:cytochrome P450